MKTFALKIKRCYNIIISSKNNKKYLATGQNISINILGGGK